MDRRKFLVQCTGSIVKASTISSLFFSGGLLIPSISHSQINDSQAKLFKRAQWQTLIAIQEHLFPAHNGAPGASQFNAKAWLYNSLTQPRVNPDVIKIYHEQIKQTNILSQKLFSKKFVLLPQTAKEQVLRQLEKNRQGQVWLAEILNYLIEALLTDPVYGSNNQAIGWKWLGHTPGFPRPTPKQKFFLL